MVLRKILTRSGPISLNTARQSHFNAVRTNRVNAVKASACWGNLETKLEDSVRLNRPEDKKVTRARKTRNYQEESFTHKEEMAPMALSDSGSNLADYKRGLASVEERLVFYKKNEVMFCEQIDVLKRDITYKDFDISVLKCELEKLKKEKESNKLKLDKFENASKSLDKLIGSQIFDNSSKGVGFRSSEFEGYGLKTSKSASEDISNEVRKSNDAPLVEKLVSDDKSEKKIVFPTVAKIEFVKSKQQEKPVRKPVKYAVWQPINKNLEDFSEVNRPEEQKGNKTRKRLGKLKATMKMQDQFDEEREQ
ncbi:hypothetical protein Tco_0793060 [Tanacetum coccineum]